MVAISEIELENQLVDYGLLYQRFISNVRFPIQIFGKLIKQLFPMNVQRAVGKETGLTKHVERLNNTFRQRVSRAGESKPIILQEAEQSYWSDLVLHPWLQCRAGKNLSLTTTSISLPKSGKSHILVKIAQRAKNVLLHFKPLLVKIFIDYYPSILIVQNQTVLEVQGKVATTPLTKT